MWWICVPLMIQFVFVFPVIYFIVKRYEAKGVLLCGLINAMYEILQSAYGMNEECYRLLLFRYILVISFGCYLALEKEIRIKNKYYVMSFVIGAIFILSCCYLNYNAKIIIYWTRTSFVACLYVLPIVAFFIEKEMKCWLLELLGRAAYNIFLVQMVYYFTYADLIYAIVDNRIMQLAINFFICCIGGIAFYIIERPVQRWIVAKTEIFLKK